MIAVRSTDDDADLVVFFKFEGVVDPLEHLAGGVFGGEPASKSLDRLMQPSLESLGEICGREGSEACEHHLKVIKEWGDIPDVSALRRFLGTFNWVRGHFPKEVQAVLPYLNAALKKDATFPLSGEQLRAKRAIQELA